MAFQLDSRPLFEAGKFQGQAMMQGMGALGKGIAGGVTAMADQRKAAQAAEKNKALVEEGKQLLATGTPQQFAEFMFANPEMAEGLEKAHAFMSKDTRENAVDTGLDIISGGDAGRALQNRAMFLEARNADSTETRAMMNAPPEVQMQYAKMMAYKADPQALKNAERVGLLSKGEATMTPYQQANLETQRERLKLAQIESDRKRALLDKRTSTQKEFQQYKALKKTDPAEAKQFGQATGFVSKEGRELSSHMQKRLSTAIDDSIKAENNSRRFNLLADDIEKAEVAGGLVPGAWGEKYKDLTGNQDAVTDLRKRYNGIRASRVVANLPPGAASDTDIALALAEFPSDNATGTQMASFLRGVAKLEDFTAEYEGYKAEHIGAAGEEREMLKGWNARQDAKVAQDLGAAREVISKAQAVQSQQLPPTNAQGWQLMKDANGNQAYVGPNGQFEEVQ